jgi:hypothetical protein
MEVSEFESCKGWQYPPCMALCHLKSSIRPIHHRSIEPQPLLPTNYAQMFDQKLFDQQCQCLDSGGFEKSTQRHLNAKKLCVSATALVPLTANGRPDRKSYLPHRPFRYSQHFFPDFDQHLPRRDCAALCKHGRFAPPYPAPAMLCGRSCR